MILFVDETMLTETPPLRAAWAQVGEQAHVAITGNRGKRVLYGVLNPKRGAVLLHSAQVWNQTEFQEVLCLVHLLRSQWQVHNIIFTNGVWGI